MIKFKIQNAEALGAQSGRRRTRLLPAPQSGETRRGRNKHQ